MKKMIKNIKLIFNIFLLNHRFDTKITLFEFLHGFCHNIRRVVNVIMPAYMVNRILENREWISILTLAICFGFLQCILGCGERCFKLLQEAHGFRACNLLRLSMNKKFMKIDYADTENAKVIDLFEEAKESMWEFCDVGYVLFDDIIGNLITFICMSYILTEINIYVYLIVLLFVSANLYVQNKKNNYLHNSVLKERVIKKHLDYISGLMQDYKVGKEVRVFDISNFITKKYNEFSTEYEKQIKIKERYVANASNIQAMLYFGQLVIVYLSAIKKYVNGKLHIGSFLLYISSINELTESIKNLLAAFVELSKVSFYYEDYIKYMNIPENLKKTGTEKVKLDKSNVIEFKNVSYCYPGTAYKAVDNISFSISNKDKIGIVGENGSGKSTLVKLLLRLYDPTEGAIYFNGKDIRLYEYDEYLSIFKTVFQDFSVFAYSILENIVFDQTVDSERLHTLLINTGLLSHIAKYKNGINSMITKILDDEGVNLSGGELQLLAITRAFYNDSEILVFDEPTAALDPVKEAEVFEMIRNLSNDKMVVFCAHRMSSTKFCDKILVLKKGCLIEMGTHNELFKQKGLYYDLFIKQASLYKQG